MQRSYRSRTAHHGPVIPLRLSNEESDPALVSSPRKEPRASPERDRGAHSAHPGTTEVLGGVYIISVAARILDMHPQTLRKYERLGLVTPTRSMGMLRLYSAEDVVRVRLIKHMVEDLGMNLAGVEFALTLLNRVLDLRERIQAMYQGEALGRFVVQELEGMVRELGGIFPDNPPRV